MLTSAHLHLTGVIDLSRARIDGFEQLVNLVITHLFAKVRQDYCALVSVQHLEALRFQERITHYIAIGQPQ